MKVLLTAVNAKYIHSNLAVYDLRAYAETYGTGGAQVEIAEYTINHTIDYILEGIYFYSGFMFFYNLGRNGKMPGSVQEIRYINRDDLGRRSGSVL